MYFPGEDNNGGNNMPNLSQLKRQRMLSFLGKIKEEHKNDDDVLIALNEIESALNAKKYGLVWEEHEEAVDVMMRDNIPVFTEIPRLEITAKPGDDYNFLLEGDNLHSLYLLGKTHKGKIDVIYIDPPYNTNSKEFIYDDKRIDYADGFRHSKWLSFMAIRLKAAKTLLAPTGAIFISIDENEFAQLKNLCDEIFGEGNFIGTLIWRKKAGGGQTDEFFVTEHEYIYGYRKSSDFKWFEFTEEANEDSFKYEDGKGKYSLTKLEKWGSSAHREDRPTMCYPVCNPEGNELLPIAPDGTPGRWRVGKCRMKDLESNNGIHWIKDELNNRWIPYEKNYFSETSGKLLKSRSILYNIAETGTATKLLTAIFGKKDVFPNPKPIEIIQFILKHTKSNLVLDFFAGSASTAHAVIMQSQEDNIQRKFIMCTNDENGICNEVTYPRMNIVATGKRSDGTEYADVCPFNLKYYKTDFVSKGVESLSDVLLEHIKEMVQLEHGIKIDNDSYIIVLSDEEADCLEKNWSQRKNVKALYISRNVLLTASQSILFSGVEQYIIPDYYFSSELREAGESW